MKPRRKLELRLQGSHVAAFWSMKDVIRPLDPLKFAGAAALQNSIVEVRMRDSPGGRRTAFWSSALRPWHLQP
jgi:hypothetical protein